MPPVATAKIAATAKPEATIGGIELSAMSDVMGRIGLSPEIQAAFLPATKKAGEEETDGTATGTDGSTADGSTTEETETARVEALAAEQGITPEEVLANEAEAETERLQTLAEESGKTIEEIQAEEAESKRLEALAAETGKTIEDILAEEAAAGGATDAAAELATARTELETATARISELETELKTRSTKPVDITQANLHPVLTVDSESDIAKLDADFASFEKWALKNWDGSPAIEASGDTAAQPAYTAEQVRERYAAIKEQRAQLIPAARQALSHRREADKIAKAAYPKLYDAKNPDAQFARQLLARAPGLKFIFPNVMMVIGDAIRGGQIRQAEEAKKKTGKPGAAAVVRPAPRIATRPAPGGGKPIGGAKPKPKAASALNVGQFIAGGGDRDSLVATLMGANL